MNKHAFFDFLKKPLKMTNSSSASTLFSSRVIKISSLYLLHQTNMALARHLRVLGIAQ